MAATRILLRTYCGLPNMRQHLSGTAYPSAGEPLPMPDEHSPGRLSAKKNQLCDGASF